MLQMLRSKNKKNKGFTLIELVIVVIILAILAVALFPSVLGKVQEAKVSRYLSDVDAIATSARMYYVDNNTWPTLVQLEPYGIESDIKDPWGGDITLVPNDAGDLVIDGAGDDAATPKEVKAPVPPTNP